MGIFVDHATEHDLYTKGVTRVDLCSKEMIGRLREEFLKLHPVLTDPMSSGYYFSVYGESLEYRKALKEQLLPIIEEGINRIFKDYKVLAVIAQIKGVGQDSAVNIHQDLTMVNEPEYRSYSLWIPLQDSTDENGPLSFLEYSQDIFRGIRSHTLEYTFGEVEDHVFENSTKYLANEGEALIFDNATIHHSSINRTETPRLSIAVSIVSKDAETEIFHYEKKKPFDGSLERYSVPDDFWYRYEDFASERLAPPKFGKKSGTKKGAQVLPYQREDFIRRYEAGKRKMVTEEFCRRVKPVLKDAKLQDRLNREGIIQVDFLSEEEVKQLDALFHDLHDQRNDIPYDRLYTCQHNEDAAYRKRMTDELERIMTPLLDRYFSNVKTTVYTFQIKGIGPNSELLVHQDWSFAREEEGNRTYTFWIPLVDSDTSNGTISVLRGSHIPVDGVRGAGISPAFDGFQKDIIPLLEPLTIKAGQLALFDSSLIHYSAPNESSSIRVSVMTNIIPSNSEVYLYFQNREELELADEYLVPNDFFLHYKDFKSEYEHAPAFGQKTRSVKKESASTNYKWLKNLISETKNTLPVT